MSSKKIIFIGIIFVFLFALLFNWYYAFYILEKDGRGVFGDAWGFSNSIFSGISLLLIVWSLIYQSKILKDQGEEIKEQSFANSYLSLINIHNDLVSSFEDDIGNQKFKGKDIFKGHFKSVENKKIAYVEDYFKQKIAPDYLHYFNFIYRILKYIDVNVNPAGLSYKTNKSERPAYEAASLFKSQLTNYELFWIQHYVSMKLENTSHTHFKNLVEKFSLFKYIKDFNKFTENYKGEFDPKAYEPESNTRNKQSE